MYLSAGNKTTLGSQYGEECDITINPLLTDAHEISPTDSINFGISEPYVLRTLGHVGLEALVVPLRITTKFEDIYINFGLIENRSWMMFDNVRRNTSNTESPVKLSNTKLQAPDIDKKAFRDHMIETSKLDVRVEVFAKRKRTAEGRVCWNLSVSICKASTWGQKLEREYVGMSHHLSIANSLMYLPYSNQEIPPLRSTYSIRTNKYGNLWVQT